MYMFTSLSNFKKKSFPFYPDYFFQFLVIFLVVFFCTFEKKCIRKTDIYNTTDMFLHIFRIAFEI